MEQNVQLQLAFNFVQYTDKNIFLTGKAGTGKTTFLHNLKQTTPKRMAIVAPTGVAAINAGGVTIHSFFQMPFGPYVPEAFSGDANQAAWNNTQHNKKFNKEKIDLIRSLDLLVIDEISMVRADTLDGIDEILRRYRDHGKPFGGIQLLMIGDLHQLAPVVKDDDWQILKDHYQNLFFFSSKALQQTAPVSIELKHIYRQSDTHFIDLLNSIRENKIDQQVLEQLNQRYIPNFNPDNNEGYITLTTHNNTAQEINELKLAEIDQPSEKYKATIGGDFPEYAYPTVADLEIKPDAQVMFVKNDPSRDRLYYNGKIGTVVRIDQGTIYVKCPGDYVEIAVTHTEWQNIKYALNPTTKEVEETVIGTFTQYPLKLAWAITIHKSQGLTFEKAIIDANAAFAHGQVYVALSRCKSFEGMVLRTPISFNSVKTDGTVAAYTKNADQQTPGEEQLSASKMAFQRSLLHDLVNFNSIKSRLGHCKRLIEEHDHVLASSLIDELNEIRTGSEDTIYAVADTFRRQLDKLLTDDQLPEDNAALQERVKKAATYFTEKVDTLLYQPGRKITVQSDNKAVQKSLDDALDNLLKEVFVKLLSMQECINGFSTSAYLRTKANAEIDFVAPSRIGQSTRTVSKKTPHAALFSELKQWRDDLAIESNVAPYLVLPQKALMELVSKLPTSLAELETIKGIGKTKLKQYGKEILAMVTTYCEKNGLTSGKITMELSFGEVKEEKKDTKLVSLELFKSGRSVNEIAVERGFTPSTIEGHLAHYISTGEIDIFKLVNKEKVQLITDYVGRNPNSTLNSAKTGLGEEVSYGELKAVMKHMEFMNE